MSGSSGLGKWIGRAALGAAVVATAPAAFAGSIFDSGFETGDTSEWSITAPGPPAVADPSFEAGPFAGIWTEFSTHLGSPICSETACNVVPPGARTGIWWAWLGGLDDDVAYVSQSVLLPPGSAASLNFHLAIPGCDSTPGVWDTFVVRANGNSIYATDNNDPDCGASTYRYVSLDVSAYLGGLLTFEFRATCDWSNPSSFFVDDVSISYSPP